jgi:hypothetical protein
MKNKVFLLITFQVISFIVAFGRFKEREEKLEKLLNDYENSPTKNFDYPSRGRCN